MTQPANSGLGFGVETPPCSRDDSVSLASSPIEAASCAATPSDVTARLPIVDDVISAGTSVRESVALIKAGGAMPGGVVIAVDRMERGTGQLSAVQEVQQLYGMTVTSIINLDDLIEYLLNHQERAQHLQAVQRYRDQYGVS